MIIFILLPLSPSSEIVSAKTIALDAEEVHQFEL